MPYKTIQYPVNFAEPLYLQLQKEARNVGISVSKLILQTLEEKYSLKPKVIRIKAPASEGVKVDTKDQFNYQLQESTKADYAKEDLYYTANRYRLQD
jgi:hypothetical protein